MEQSEPIRQACDLCYRRRIKCDGQKPRCSHCVSRDSDCTRKTAARKWTPRKGAREAALESRVKTLEAELSTALEKIRSLEKPAGISNSASKSVGESSLPIAHSSGHNTMWLDSLHDILPVIEWYLATSNSLIPLFDPSTLLTAVKDWFYKPHTRDRDAVTLFWRNQVLSSGLSWWISNSGILHDPQLPRRLPCRNNAKIRYCCSVVLALAHHSGYPGRKSRSINTTAYINNAQSILTDAIAHKTSLIHIQVLIGLCMLFRTANEPTPAVVLIATALRLAHKLELHRRSSEQHDYTLCLQRDRVFWAAYILDRSISLQIRISPVQLDSDIDLDIPPLEPPCGNLDGFAVANDGQTKFNFLRASIQMARIQGLVYNCIYSASRHKPGSTEEAHNVAFIHQELDAWTDQVPIDFHPTVLLQAGGSELSKHFCMLYSVRLSCRAIISYGNARDSFHYSHWVGSLQDHGEKGATGQTVSRIADQQGWSTLVKESRDYLKLFMTIKSRDAIFIIKTLCAYTTSLICLVANNMFDADNSLRASDDMLIEAAISPLGDIVRQTGSLEETYSALQKLRSYAQIIPQHHDSQLSSFPSEPSWMTTLEPMDSGILDYLFTIPEWGPP
ncbi:hypothetical protein F5Y19DRAFT_485018 [Xylariaceae sp. FL1651]|nr:hypothetical protein F5Y19DRAFT_485018 [Xylariaceae sp. FL1651]